MTAIIRADEVRVSLHGLRPEDPHDTGTAIASGYPGVPLRAAAPHRELAIQIADLLEIPDVDEQRLNDLAIQIAEERRGMTDCITINADRDFAMRAPIHGNHHLIAWTGMQHGYPVAVLRNGDTGRPSVEDMLRRAGYTVSYPEGTRNSVVWLGADESPCAFLEGILRIASERVPVGTIKPFQQDTAMAESDHYPPGMPV